MSTFQQLGSAIDREKEAQFKADLLASVQALTAQVKALEAKIDALQAPKKSAKE